MVVALGVRRVSYFCFLDTWWFHRSLSRPLLILLLLYTVISCTAVLHGGWVDRFVGVTAVVLRSAVLL